MDATSSLRDAVRASPNKALSCLAEHLNLDFIRISFNMETADSIAPAMRSVGDTRPNRYDIEPAAYWITCCREDSHLPLHTSGTAGESGSR